MTRMQLTASFVLLLLLIVNTKKNDAFVIVESIWSRESKIGRCH